MDYAGGMAATRYPAAPRPARAPRGAVVALLWLLIALMPLRALSQELMAAAAGSVPLAACHGLGSGAGALPAHGAQAPALHAAHAAPPGHDAAHASTHAPAQVLADGGAPDDAGAAPCQACDLCHAVLAVPMALACPHALPGHDPVAGGQARWAAAPADGIFRPPRG